MKALASIILLGFVLLALLGAISIGPDSQSAVACMASSVASVSCPTGEDGLSFAKHNIGAFNAVTSVVLSVILLSLSMLCVCFLFIKELLPDTLLHGVKVQSDYIDSSHLNRSITLTKQSSWLSMFISSPNN
jgi:hypothetical protein